MLCRVVTLTFYTGQPAYGPPGHRILSHTLTRVAGPVTRPPVLARVILRVSVLPRLFSLPTQWVCLPPRDSIKAGHRIHLRRPVRQPRVVGPWLRTRAPSRGSGCSPGHPDHHHSICKKCHARMMLARCGYRDPGWSVDAAEGFFPSTEQREYPGRHALVCRRANFEGVPLVEVCATHGGLSSVALSHARCFCRYP
jgi:hypothetical protein